jgi:hypothetical protein
MERVRKRFFRCIIVLCLLLDSESRAFSTSEGLCLNAKHSVYGTAKIYLSKAGMKVVNANGGRIMISKPPDWKVAVFDTDTKLFFVGTQDEFARGDFANLFNVIYSQRHIIPVKTSVHATIAGIKVTKYMVGGDKPVPKTHKKEVAYWVAEDTGLPAEVCTVHSIISGLPKLPGITLRASYPPGAGMKVNNVDTTGAEKMKFADDFFKYPSEFKKATSMRQLLFNQDIIKDFVSP